MFGEIVGYKKAPKDLVKIYIHDITNVESGTLQVINGESKQVNI